MANQTKYQFSDRDIFQRICGIADCNIAPLEEFLQVQLVPRGSALLIQSDREEQKRTAALFFRELERSYSSQTVEEGLDKLYLYQRIKRRVAQSALMGSENWSETKPKAKTMAGIDRDRVVYICENGRPIYANTERQAAYVSSLLNHPVTICLGPAGTGKTFLSIAVACQLLTTGRRSRLVITRPAVEAGESLGFLPGDLAQKIDPYLRPIYDALYDCLGYQRVSDMMQNRQIEMIPLAFMRGRTLNNSIALLDEGQNCTTLQLKMFLTRLGRDTSICLSGDVTQIDLRPGRSGLQYTADLLEKVEGVGVVRFKKEDIVRNPIVERIISIFENEEAAAEGRGNSRGKRQQEEERGEEKRGEEERGEKKEGEEERGEEKEGEKEGEEEITAERRAAE